VGYAQFMAESSVIEYAESQYPVDTWGDINEPGTITYQT